MSVYECRFLIPNHEDADIGSGDLHPRNRKKKLDRDLYGMFGGWTLSPGYYEGVYQDPDTGLPVRDKSRQYVIALEEEKIPELREYLKKVAVEFRQKVVYFFNGKEVEFIGNPERYPK